MASPAERYRRAGRAVGALFLANGTVVGSWFPHIPGVAQRLQLSTQSLGLVLLASGVGALAAMALAPVLGRRLGTRLVAVAGGTLMPCTVAVAVLAPSPVGVAAALFLTGLGGASMDVAMNAQGVLVERRLETRALSLYHGLFSVGCFAGSAATSTALARGARPGMVAVALACAVVTLVLAALPFLIPQQAAAHASAARASFHTRNRVLLLLGALTFAAFVSEGGMGDWSALLLQRMRGLSLGTAGFGYTALSAAMLLARLAGDRLTGRFGERTTLQASGLLSAMGLAAVLLAPGLPLVFAGFFATGLGLANASPILYRSAGHVPGSSPEAALALAVGLGYVGLLTGPPLLGVLGHHAGLRSIFVVLIALQLLVALAAGRVLSEA